MKYATLSEEIFFKLFLVISQFLSLLSFFITSLQSLILKETSPLISILFIAYVKFLLYNVLHSAGNIHWQTFLK